MQSQQNLTLEVKNLNQLPSPVNQHLNTTTSTAVYCYYYNDHRMLHNYKSTTINKIGTEVAHVTRDSDTIFKVKGQLVADVLDSQHVGTVINTKILL